MRVIAMVMVVFGFLGGSVFAEDSMEEQRLIQRAVYSSRRLIEAKYSIDNEPVRATTEQIEERIAELDLPNPEWACVQWYGTSIRAGFTHDDWPEVGIIAFRESRCNPGAYNGSDPAGGSYSLMQVNGSWRRWLRDRGIINDVSDLFDPLTNLVAARAIVQYDRDRGNCDWKQWSTRRGLC